MKSIVSVDWTSDSNAQPKLLDGKHVGAKTAMANSIKPEKPEAIISNWKQGAKHAMENEITASCKQLL